MVQQLLEQMVIMSIRCNRGPQEPLAYGGIVTVFFSLKKASLKNTMMTESKMASKEPALHDLGHR